MKRIEMAKLVGLADKVICDVPCSGLGVLGKKPDLRYKNLETLVELPILQGDILAASSAYLKPSGVLVYSTCTLNPEENEVVVNKFLENHKNFRLVPFSLADIESEGGMLTLTPMENETDGFFIAKLQRK